MTLHASHSAAAALVAGLLLITVRETRAQVPEPPAPPRGRIGQAVDPPPPRSRAPARPTPATPDPRLVPEQQPELRLRPNDWRLGVEVDNLETGVEVTRVFPGSPASRAGLERGDIIVSVGGFQVGFVGRQLYDLGDELRQQADQRGRVRMLVLNNRNARLTNLDVTLDRGGGNGGGIPPLPPARSTITGSVTYRERIALPPGARLEVRLIQQRHGRTPARVIATESNPIRGQVPISFTLEYDDRDIIRGASYVLEAEITAGNRSLFVTPQQVQVLTGPGNERVDLVLTSSR